MNPLTSVCLALLCLTQASLAVQILADYEHNFYQEFNKYEQDGVRTEELTRLIAVESQQASYGRKCLACRATVFSMLEYYKSNYTVARLKDIAVTLCTLFNQGDVHICNGYVNNFAVNELDLW